MRRSKFLSGLMIGLCVVIGISGCSTRQPIQTTLTEMGSISDVRYGHDNIAMMQSINISGMGADDIIGTIVYNPDSDRFWRKWEFEDFSDSLSPRMDLNTTVKKIYSKENNISISDVIAIKDSILISQQLQSKKVSNEIKLDILKEIKTKFKFFQDNNNIAEQNIFVEKLVASNLISQDADTVKAIDESIKSLTIEQMSIDDNLSHQQQSIKKDGIMIARWERESELGTSAKILSAVDSNTSNNKKLQGIVVLGNPVIYTLYIGKDIKNILPSLTLFENDNSMKHAFITFHQLRAQHVAYAETSELSFELSVHADIDKLLSSLKGVENLKSLTDLSIKIQTAHKSFLGQMTTGAFSAFNREDIVVSGRSQLKKEIGDDFKNTFPIISSRVSVYDLLELLNKK